MQLIKIGVTGHRPDKLLNDYDGSGPCTAYIRQEIKSRLESFSNCIGISGMALGVDTIFAELILGKQKPLIAAIPFKGQESRWPLIAQEKYHQLLSNKLVTTQIICDKYSKAAMQIRNEWIVNNCDILIAVWNGIKGGGTWNTVNYARSWGKEILYINPNDWAQNTTINKLF